MSSVTALGREFRILIDIELQESPTLTPSNNKERYKYLRDVSTNSNFMTAVLKIIVEERRNAHRERWNNENVPQMFQVRDVVKTHVQVQSKYDTGEVKKVSCQARGPFQIKSVLGNNSYEAHQYNEPESATRKFKGTDL